MSDEKTAYEELEDLKDSVKTKIRDKIDEMISENPDYDGETIKEKIDYGGSLTETVDSSVPIYNGELMDLGGLVEVFQHVNELGPAFDGEPTPVNIVATSIYEILMEVAWVEVDDYLEELDDEGKFDNEAIDLNALYSNVDGVGI